MADMIRIQDNQGIHPTQSMSTDADAECAKQSQNAEADTRHRISLIKGQERWNFRWEPGAESLLINRIAEMARDPNVPFDWFDAAVVCKHIAQPYGSSTLHKNKP